MQPFKLSPSELTFLWDECPRCFYLKSVYNFNRPWSPFPKIFNQIDKIMKRYFEDKPSNEISNQLPEGEILFAEKWVTSQVITLPGRLSSCYIRGKFDSLVKFNDNSYGIIDFKTSSAKPEHVNFYSRQLHAYKYALENPAPGSLSLSPITRLGLLSVEPVNMFKTKDGKIAYIGDVTWQECPRDDNGFLSFLNKVLSVLESDMPPEAGTDCGYCQYRQAARNTGY